MKNYICLNFSALIVFALCTVYSVNAQEKMETDILETEKGNLVMTFVGHGTLMFELGGKVIHIDPTIREADYSKMPKADLILITHQHGDHLDMNAINNVLKEKTKLIMTEICKSNIEFAGDVHIMKNGDKIGFEGMVIDAVAAYNIEHKRADGTPFHPKGEGNGYVLSIGNKKIYIAGDTENIPEMSELTNIDIAFLPMNLPYTMTPEMTAEAAKMFMPKVLYPYHFGDTDTSKLLELLKNEKGIEVRIRDLK